MFKTVSACPTHAVVSQAMTELSEMAFGRAQAYSDSTDSFIRAFQLYHIDVLDQSEIKRIHETMDKNKSLNHVRGQAKKEGLKMAVPVHCPLKQLANKLKLLINNKEQAALSRKKAKDNTNQQQLQNAVRSAQAFAGRDLLRARDEAHSVDAHAEYTERANKRRQVSVQRASGKRAASNKETLPLNNGHGVESAAKRSRTVNDDGDNVMAPDEGKAPVSTHAVPETINSVLPVWR